MVGVVRSAHMYRKRYKSTKMDNEKDTSNRSSQDEREGNGERQKNKKHEIEPGMNDSRTRTNKTEKQSERYDIEEGRKTSSRN